jgi:hypothetical protein
MYAQLVAKDREEVVDDESPGVGCIAGLLKLDGTRALDLFVNAPQTTESRGGGGLTIDEVSNRLNRHPVLQLRYLDGVWQHPRAKQMYNASTFSELHKLQVQLYAHYQRDGLNAFLRSSEHYDLRSAFDVCQSCEPPMYQEMVYILSRLGNTKEALALIIEELEDVPQAIEFIKNSHDPSLWADLVERSLKSPRFIAG